MSADPCGWGIVGTAHPNVLPVPLSLWLWYRDLRKEQKVDKERLEAVERALRARLEEAGLEGDLKSACEYAVFSGGKRFRPLLTMASAEACGGDYREALAPACAVEFLHTFTLIQDDLPDLDNDAERRGQPTTHIRFGTANALMASDALFGLAFYTLACAKAPAKVRARAVALAARRIALPGVVGGQVYDLQSPWRRSRGPHDPPPSVDSVLEVNRLKTGSLMALSLELGALFAGADAQRLRTLGALGENLGILFQIADDLEDPKDREILSRALGNLEELKRRADLLYEATLREARGFGNLPRFVRWAYTRKL
jgi:geranylgeranyl pyrophosphate synthase